MKCVLLGVGVEAVRAVALVNRTTTAELLAAALELDAIPVEHLSERDGFLDSFEVHPIGFHDDLLMSLVEVV